MLKITFSGAVHELIINMWISFPLKIVSDFLNKKKSWQNAFKFATHNTEKKVFETEHIHQLYLKKIFNSP